MSFRRIAPLAVFVVLPFTMVVHADPLPEVRLTPDELKWVKWDAGVTGNQRAFVVGDERRPGVYVWRERLRPGAKLEPHFHPDERIVTVLSGTVYVGYGEQFDEAAMKPLPAGSIWTEPARQPHFLWVKEGEAVVQVTGTDGPTGLVRVGVK